ncbi:hypothetical protein BJY01DRAFT_164832 [Aspergillus pseudoustus]|uniref:Uncharacterized protein n=1 Tax=Aspergillus pseudoustus TaxID=1810923 RepID=A0ABR4K5C5_9EURO
MSSLQKLKPQQKHSAASASKVPTIQSLKETRRTISYNATPEERDSGTSSPTSATSSRRGSGDKGKIDQAGCDQMLKASLTGILNSGEVKSDSRGRKVQELLMETQKDLRKQRRASLGEREHSRAKAKLAVIEAGMKS